MGVWGIDTRLFGQDPGTVCSAKHCDKASVSVKIRLAGLVRHIGIFSVTISKLLSPPVTQSVTWSVSQSIRYLVRFFFVEKGPAADVTDAPQP
jgi:hypothetical protein